MSVTKSPVIADLVRETRQRLGLTRIAVCPPVGSLLSKCESMGERQD